MSKIRNSLGVLVLPIPYDEMTWEQYKDQYGIDLNSTLPLYKNASGKIRLKGNGFDKILYLEDKGDGDASYSTMRLNPVLWTDTSAITDDDVEIGGRYGLGINNTSPLGLLTIDIYDDVDTPNTIYFTEL